MQYKEKNVGFEIGFFSSNCITCLAKKYWNAGLVSQRMKREEFKTEEKCDHVLFNILSFWQLLYNYSLASTFLYHLESASHHKSYCPFLQNWIVAWLASSKVTTHTILGYGSHGLSKIELPYFSLKKNSVSCKHEILNHATQKLK